MASTASAATQATPTTAVPTNHSTTNHALTFLATVQRVSISETTKDGNGDSCLVLNVTMRDDTVVPTDPELADVALAAAARADAAAGIDTRDTTTLQVLRTFKELRDLEKDVTQWAKQHVSHSAGDVPASGVDSASVTCSYCSHFASHETAKLWPGGTLTRLVHSKQTIEEQYEVCVNDYIKFAQQAPPVNDYGACKGYEHIPSIVARFLLHELPLHV